MLYVTSYHILLLYVIFLIIPRAQGFRVSSLRSVSSMMRVSSVDSNSIKQDAFTLENQSVYCQLVNIFGRLAEQKALGYTSSYKVTHSKTRRDNPIANTSHSIVLMIQIFHFRTENYMIDLILVAHRHMFPHLCPYGFRIVGVDDCESMILIGNSYFKMNPQ